VTRFHPAAPHNSKLASHWTVLFIPKKSKRHYRKNGTARCDSVAFEDAICELWGGVCTFFSIAPARTPISLFTFFPFSVRGRVLVRTGASRHYNEVEKWDLCFIIYSCRVCADCLYIIQRAGAGAGGLGHPLYTIDFLECQSCVVGGLVIHPLHPSGKRKWSYL
jgi:hypothetical protein